MKERRVSSVMPKYGRERHLIGQHKIDKQ